MVSIILNAVIVGLELFATLAMFFDWDFMLPEDNTEDSRWAMFRYFTIDSNIVAGAASLVMLICEIRCASGSAEAIPLWVYIFKLMGTTAVTLTFVTTVCFLTPTVKNKIHLYANSNLFYHVVVPILAIVSVLFFEGTSTITFPQLFWGILPTALYELYYTPRVFTHLNPDGTVNRFYDFYNFLIAGKKTAPAVMFLILLISFLFALGLWAGSHAIL